MISSSEGSIAIAKSIVMFRERKGMSQEALATQLGKSQSYVAKIETGHRKISLIEFLTICSSLEIDFDDVSKELLEVYKKIQLKSLWKNNDI